MYEVLFIDDEPLALEGLSSILDWESLNFHILNACSNGESAIKVIKEHAPDLIITDICMPGISGLDFIEYVKNNISNDIEFIITTGYSEFPYAKRAMQYGIKHFLLKPLFKEELEEIIYDIKQKLDMRNAEKTQLNDSETTIISEILTRTIYGNCDDDDFIILEKYMYGTPLTKAWSYIKAICETSKSTFLYSEFSTSMLQELFPDTPLFLVQKEEDFLGIVIGFPQNDKSVIEKIIKDLNVVLSHLKYISQSIIVGEVVPHITAIISSYISTMQTTAYTFITKNEDIVFYSDSKDEILNYMPYNIDYMRLIIEALEDSDLSKVNTLIEETFAYFRTELFAPEIIMMFTVNIIYKGISIVNDLGGESEELKSSYLTFLEKKQYSSIDNLRDILVTFCLQCCQSIDKIRKHNQYDIAVKIEELLKSQFKNNIKIKDISDQLHMNPAYFGQLFHKKFGMSFNEYINRMRVMEAKKLIDNSDMKMYEIAEAVGYKDYKGFFQQFEKIIGTKPQEYKNAQK